MKTETTHTHTQGPWKVLENARGNGKICVCTSSGAPVHAVICEIDIRSIGTDYLIRLANANLIAAAPDLLAALNSVLEDLCDFQDAYPDLSGQFDGTFSKINAAIAKAEGNV